MHPASGRKAAKASIGVGNGEDPGRSPGGDEFRQMGVLRRGQGQALATGPAASGYHLEEGQLMRSYASGQLVKPLQMAEVLPANYDIKVHQQSSQKGIFHSLHRLGEDALPSPHGIVLLSQGAVQADIDRIKTSIF